MSTATERGRAWLRAMRHAGAVKKTAGKVPRQQPPDRLGIEFGRILARWLDPIVRAAFAEALPELRALVEAAAADRAAMLRGDARADADFNAAARARAILERVRQGLADAAKQRDVEALAKRSAAQVAAMNRAQLARQTRSALGVDVFASDRRLPSLIDAFAEANVGLIKGLTDKVAADVEAAVVNTVQDGGAWGTLADDLEQRIGMPARRAEIIARDQVGKLYGQVNAARQREIGVRRFTWRSVDDERVRGKPGGKYPKARPSHWDRHGKVYSYDEPPLGELPGEPILCRCTAEPIFDDLLDDEDVSIDDEVVIPAPPPAPRPPAATTPAGFQRGSALPARSPIVRGAPSYAQTKHGTGYVVEPADIADRVIAMPGGGEDAARLERIRTGFAQGVKFGPIRATVLPDGRYLIEDGRHRLLVAAEQGRTVLLQIERGLAEGAAGTVPLLAGHRRR